MSKIEDLDGDSETSELDRGDFDYDAWERASVKRDLCTKGYDDEDVPENDKRALIQYSPDELAQKIDAVKEALQAFAGADAVDCDTKLSLLHSLHRLESEYKRITELDERSRLEWEDRRRTTNLGYYGFESIAECVCIYDEAVMAAAKLSRAEREAFAFFGEGKTQSEIAKKLRKTQQAVSKSLFSAQSKYQAAQRIVGGPHPRPEFQLIHFADTRTLSEWGKAYLREQGKPPERCRCCPKVTIPPAIVQEAPVAAEKHCERCNNYCAAWRDACPACGGELVSARKEKRKRA